MIKYLILGGTHHNTLGLMESLYEVGIKPYVIIYSEIEHHSYIEHSNWYEKFWLFTKSDYAVACMLENCKSEEGKTVVITGSDYATCMLDDYFDVLSPYFVLPLCKEKGEVHHWINKDVMGALADKVGLITPPKWIVKDRLIPDDIKYPCITKAISSVDGTKFDMKICQTKEELNVFLEGNERCSTMVVQKFIKKAFEFQLLGVSLNHGEDVVITGRTNIDRPNGIDNTFFLRFQKCEPEFDDTINHCKAFIKQTGYQGPFSIEFLKGQDGVNYFMEMNFRNDGNAICQNVAGINVPYIWYLYGIGKDWKTEVKNSKIHTVHLIPEYQQFKFWIKGEISLKELIRDFKMADKWITYFKNDKAPFFWLVINRIRGLF